MLKHKFIISHSHKVCHLSKSYNGWEILLGAQISWHSCRVWATLLTWICRHLGCISSAKKDFAREEKCKLNDRNHLGRGGILPLPEVDLMRLTHGKIIHFESALRTWMITRDLNHLFVTERWILLLHHVPSRTPQRGALGLTKQHGQSSQRCFLQPCAPTAVDGQLPTSAQPAYFTISGQNCCLKERIKTNPQMTLSLGLFKNGNRNTLTVSCTSDKGQGHFRVSCSVHKYNSNLN